MTPARMASVTPQARYRRGGPGTTPVSGPWGPPSLPAPQGAVPETEEEYVEYFQDRISSSQGRQLFPLQEDLADWINKTLEVDHVTGENFLDMLDNGVLVCHLAQVIHTRAQQLVDRGCIPGPAPPIKGRCWERAARKSFFSRDNMENFITFCRRLGVHDNLLFESDDLVLHHQPRNVVLCLLEVARLAARFGVEPPGLVQLEKEIAEEESQLLSWQFHASASPIATPRASPDKIRHSSSSSAISGGSMSRWGRTPIGRPRSGERRSLMLLETSPSPAMSPGRDLRRTASEGNNGPGATSGGASDGVPSDTTEDDWSRGSGEDPDLEIDHDLGPTRGGGDADLSELDRKVQQATRVAQRHCHCPPSKCSKLKVKKVGEGRYNIAGRNVFIRLLKGRHMMVRVGGGWDTLEHFLLRHDPCQIKVVSRDSPTNRSYLHIQAKYRSPPPAEPVGR